MRPPVTRLAMHLCAGIAFDGNVHADVGSATPASATVNPSNVTLGCEIVTT